MTRTTRLTAIAATTLVAVLLSGCGAGSGGDPADPAARPGTAGDAPLEAPCIVGTWQLDVPDYASQSEAYVLGLGLPIEGFAMTGAGTLRFTDDGLVSSEISLTTTGTIVAGDTRVPLDSTSAYTGSGDWSTGATTETIDLANWASLPGPNTSSDPSAPPIPAIDYTDIPSIAAECSADSLLLQVPGAPLSTLWHR